MCAHTLWVSFLSPSGQVTNTEKGEDNVTVLIPEGTQADFPVQIHGSVGDVL